MDSRKIMDEKEKILKQSLAIRTFPIAKVKTIVDNFKLDNHIEVKPFKSTIRQWLSKVVDLSDFKYLYPVNGITEGINYWYMQEKRKVIRHKDDYVWLPENKDGEYSRILKQFAPTEFAEVSFGMKILITSVRHFNQR